MWHSNCNLFGSTEIPSDNNSHGCVKKASNEKNLNNLFYSFQPNGTDNQLILSFYSSSTNKNRSINFFWSLIFDNEPNM